MDKELNRYIKNKVTGKIFKKEKRLGLITRGKDVKDKSIGYVVKDDKDKEAPYNTEEKASDKDAVVYRLIGSSKINDTPNK